MLIILLGNVLTEGANHQYLTAYVGLCLCASENQAWLCNCYKPLVLNNCCPPPPSGGGFVLLALLAFLPSVISSFFTQIKGGGGVGGGERRTPAIDLPLLPDNGDVFSFHRCFQWRLKTILDNLVFKKTIAKKMAVLNSLSNLMKAC